MPSRITQPTPLCRCRHPTWAGLVTRRQPVARRVADRLATSSRAGAQAGRPRLALDWHDRTVDPSRKSGQRSRAVRSGRAVAVAKGEKVRVGRAPGPGPMPGTNPNTQDTHAGSTATSRRTNGLCATREYQPDPTADADGLRATITRPLRAPRNQLTARAPRWALTARAPAGTNRPVGRGGLTGLCASGY